MTRSAFATTITRLPLAGAGVRLLRSVGWPVLCGAVLMVVGGLLLGISYQLRAQTSQLQRELGRLPATSAKAPVIPLRGIPVIFPPSADYAADLAQIFDLAKSQGIVLANGDYRDAEPTALGLDIRTVDLRINENYAKLKDFLASVLNAMPHAAVQELRIERKDGVTVKHQIFLKLALVYSPRPGNPPGPKPVGKPIPANTAQLPPPQPGGKAAP